MAKAEHGEFRVAEQVLSASQVADHLGVNVETVRDWIRHGDIEAMFFGGTVGYRIEAKELQRFKDARKGAAAVMAARELRAGRGRTESELAN